jgi:hypothetical protein
LVACLLPDTGQAGTDDQDVEVLCVQASSGSWPAVLAGRYRKRIAEGTVASLDHFRHTFIISRRQKS